MGEETAASSDSTKWVLCMKEVFRRREEIWVPHPWLAHSLWIWEQCRADPAGLLLQIQRVSKPSGFLWAACFLGACRSFLPPTFTMTDLPGGCSERYHTRHGTTRTTTATLPTQPVSHTEGP